MQERCVGVCILACMFTIFYIMQASSYSLSLRDHNIDLTASVVALCAHPKLFGINRCFSLLVESLLLEPKISQANNMFVTILFGDSRMEMLNLNCKLINFIQHLKERSGLDLKECVELMDSSGRLMNLEGMQHSVVLASSVLVERQYYVLLRVCRNEDTGGRKYVSLLNNFSQSHPELTELLGKLSNPEKERDRKIRTRTKRSRPAEQTKSKNFSANNKKDQIN